jgi:hypothetical protein
MSKFLESLNRYYENTGLDQPVEDPNAEMPMPEPEGEPEAAPEPEVDPLTSEGEVHLTRLLRKALLMNVEEGDVDDIALEDDINETNSRQMVDKIIGVMRKYTDDI